MKTNKTADYVVNISKVFDLSSVENKKRGKEWYLAARVAASQISMSTGIPIMNVCAVIAALSPRNKWERNIVDAKTLCTLKDNFESGKYSTFGANVKKAYAALWAIDRDSVLVVLNGKKVCSFFDNIFDPSSTRVTIDVHMQLVALGKYIAEDDRPSLTDKVYREIEEAVKTVALKNGLLPYELQAIAWVTWKDQKHENA